MGADGWGGYSVWGYDFAARVIGGAEEPHGALRERRRYGLPVIVTTIGAREIHDCRSCGLQVSAGNNQRTPAPLPTFVAGYPPQDTPNDNT